ncbi:DNA repair protein RecO [Lentibacillus cibarius]|uniref:DNA repair protein RecO n=1 Tax=Lentibacillus cibarius TaxID=2583219 RepID=A0A5S3QIE7_9BACI|nr:DNA repair protein RecO [Lentibacillus cibarius]TMN20991.1 DNA repair protein RecO [Lentibacillus cibarius]
MLEKMEGIVIKTQNYGESHKIVTLFSDKLGKIAAIARGAKKPKSRMAAVTQPFIIGEFFIYVNSGLSTIQQGDVIDANRQIREDILKTAYASYVAELTDKLTDSQTPDPQLYKQLNETLNWMAEKEDAAIPIMMYELKIFIRGGFSPVLDKCVHCGNKAGPFVFSIAEGGFLCPQCKHFDREAISLSDKLAQLLWIFAEVELERIGTISVKEENRKLLRQIIDAYYDAYGGYYLKSKRFLRQLDKLL